MLGSIQENSSNDSGEEFASAEAAAAAERRARLPEIARNFGVKAAHCPNCGVQLQKFPKRKIKCKSCAKPVYPRKNPVTNQIVLIKETDFDRLRELQCYVDGSWDAWFRNFFELETIRAQLAAEWGLDDAAKVPVADAEWRRITMRASNSFANSDWIEYYAARAAGIGFLSNERRYAEAVPLACEFIYLAYNVNRMERAYEALGLPEDMRTPIGPLKMHPPQIVSIDFVEPDIDRLREAYMQEMEQNGLHRIFGMAPEEAFERYRQEKLEHRQALRDNGDLESYLGSIERARSQAK